MFRDLYQEWQEDCLRKQKLQLGKVVREKVFLSPNFVGGMAKAKSLADVTKISYTPVTRQNADSCNNVFNQILQAVKVSTQMCMQLSESLSKIRLTAVTVS